MTRHPDWQARLDAYVAAHMTTAFDWQAHNCTTFAAGWVFEATGHAIEVPSTDTALVATRCIAKLGGLLADARRQLGAELPGAMAQCGDVVLLTVAGTKAFGVCLGSVCAAQGHEGLVMVPITEAEAAWRV